VKYQIRISPNSYIEVDGDTVKSVGLKTHQNFEHSSDSVNVAIDAVESFVLALAGQGFDITTESFRQALLETLDAIENNVD
jgi:urate oxidase